MRFFILMSMILASTTTYACSYEDITEIVKAHVTKDKNIVTNLYYNHSRIYMSTSDEEGEETDEYFETHFRYDSVSNNGSIAPMVGYGKIDTQTCSPTYLTINQVEARR